jgi:hypothetical protein
MTESWIEPRTKIPLVGIISMVLIVVVVAIFMKTQLSALFPSADVRVESERQNTVGSSSASFYGEREVILTKTVYWQGILQTPSQVLRIQINTNKLLMLLTENSVQEEIMLTQQEGNLVASVERDGVQTLLIFDPITGQLRMSQPGQEIGVTTVQLSQAPLYEGSFTLRNEDHDFVFSPSGSYALVAGSRVTLAQSEELYTGMWKYAGKMRPIRVNAENGIATISEIY